MVRRTIGEPMTPALKDLSMYTQPMLFIPPEIELGLLEGTLKIFGSVVREADTGRIFKHLYDIVPSPERVEEAVKSMKLNPKIVVSVVAVTVAVGGAATFIVRKRRKRATLVAVDDLPKCVTDFEASLRAYVDAGRAGVLDAGIIEQFIVDLDEIKAFSEEGYEVKISLDDLVPLFGLVIAHTSKLAEAYDVELDDFDEQESDAEDRVVVSLRRHLEAQKTILAEAV